VPPPDATHKERIVTNTTTANRYAGAATSGITLNATLRDDAMRPEWYACLRHWWQEFLVPTTVVLMSWQPPRPKTGRLYATGHVARGDRVWTEPQYAAHRAALGLDAHARVDPADDDVLLAEWWCNDGRDGATYYRFEGWVFVGTNALAAARALVTERYPNVNDAATQYAIETLVGWRL